MFRVLEPPWSDLRRDAMRGDSARTCFLTLPSRGCNSAACSFLARSLDTRHMRIHRIYGLISPRFFEKRKREFHRLMRPRKEDRILDVGGTPWFWRSMDCEAHITCLNIET